MKKLLPVVLIVALLVIAVEFFFFRNKPQADNSPIQQPLTVSKHSAVFNMSANKMLDAYYNLTEAFVVWDTSAVNTRSNELNSAIDSLKLSELQKDTIIYETAAGIRANAKSEIEGLINDPSLEEKKLAFNSLTQYVYDLLRTVHYDQSKVYFQECPMAFGEDHPGNWLSKTVAVRNPYLGTQHPKYKDEMLTCGGPRDTLNFMLANTSNQ